MLSVANYTLGVPVTKAEQTQVAILIHMKKEQAIDIFRSFVFTDPADKDKIKPVLEKFEGYFSPKKNVVLHVCITV